MSNNVSKRPKVYWGWWSVIFIGIASGLGHGFNTYGISIFFKHIADDLNLNRAVTSWAPGMGKLEGGVTSPFVGWLSDKFGPRWMVVGGLFFTATGMVLMNYITETWQYIVVWGGLIGFGLNIGLTVACDKHINDWFIRRRGLAQGIKFGLVSILAVVTIQAITMLIDSEGWRFTCVVWGIIMYACIPLAYILIKPERPERYGWLPDGADAGEQFGASEIDLIARGIGYASDFQETDYTFRQAIRTATFWMMTAGFSVHTIVASGFNLHVYPFLTDIGLVDTAGGLMILMIIFTLPGRFFGGLIADRVPKLKLQYLLVTAFAFQVIGISTYLLSGTHASVYFLLACHGLSTGAVTPVVVLMIGRYFGRGAFGSIMGTLVALLAPLGMVSPVFYGWIFDVTSSYRVAFITSLSLACLAVIVTFFIRPPKINDTAV